VKNPHRLFRGADQKAYDKARKRLDKVRGPQVKDWADSTLWATQAGLDGFRVTADEASLREAKVGAIGLLAAIDSLLDRTR
jgi:hypothetical protein